jgi:hypothetical protein
MKKAINDIESKKSPKTPSDASLISKLKQQLAEKDEQQKMLNKALVDLKNDLLDISKSNLINFGEEKSQDKRIETLIEKVTTEYQDKICKLGEEMAKVKNELKLKTKTNDELTLELDHLKAQLSKYIFIFYYIKLKSKN